MKKISRILAPTDFSDQASAALAPAVELAKQYDASLHLLHAIVLHDFRPLEGDAGFPDLGEVEEALAKRALELFEVLAKEHIAPEILVEKVERRGIAPATVILDYARDEEIDLIVMATHGRRGLRRFLLGSVAEEVVQHADCPVLTVPARAVKTSSERPSILAPVDFSERSLAAADEAASLARGMDARLDLLHVVLRPMHPAAYDAFVELAPDTRELEALAKPKLEELAKALSRGGLEVATQVAIGPPAQTIVEVAESSGARMVVMASHGLSGVAHLLLGSVAERVVRTAPCQVLTIKRAEAPEGVEAS